MIDKYEIKTNADGNHVLVNYQGREVYEWGPDGYSWPDKDALEAVMENANLGNPQKAFFATMFLGPKTPEQIEQGDPP